MTYRRLDPLEKNIWDIYISDSLIGTAREKRGKGIRLVDGRNYIPRNWQMKIKQNCLNSLPNASLNCRTQINKQQRHAETKLCAIKIASKQISLLAHTKKLTPEQFSTLLMQLNLGVIEYCFELWMPMW